MINIQEISMNWSFLWNRWLFRSWFVLQTYILLKSCSERQNLLEVARTAKNCSKRQKLLKSCLAQSGQAYLGERGYVTQQFCFSFPNLDAVLENSLTVEKLRRWNKSLKFETVRIHFLQWRFRCQKAWSRIWVLKACSRLQHSEAERDREKVRENWGPARVNSDKRHDPKSSDRA